MSLPEINFYTVTSEVSSLHFSRSTGTLHIHTKVTIAALQYMGLKSIKKLDAVKVFLLVVSEKTVG